MPLFDIFWSMLWFFLFIAWVWTVVAILGDVFRSRDLGGFAKAGWVLFIITIPWLGILVYIIARGDRIADRYPAAASPGGTRDALKVESTYYWRR